MQRLCDKYNRAIDSIHQLVSVQLGPCHRFWVLGLNSGGAEQQKAVIDSVLPYTCSCSISNIQHFRFLGGLSLVINLFSWSHLSSPGVSIGGTFLQKEGKSNTTFCSQIQSCCSSLCTSGTVILALGKGWEGKVYLHLTQGFLFLWCGWEFVLILYKTFLESLTMSVEWKMIMGYWYDGNLMQFCYSLVNLVETGNVKLCKALKRCIFSCFSAKGHIPRVHLNI